MKSLLPPTPQRRKNRVMVMQAELFRDRGEANWKLRVRYGGKRSCIYETGTPHEAAAKEWAVAAIRNFTRQP